MPLTTHPPLNQILAKIHPLKSKGLTLVLATGVFDLLHQEHKAFLHKAKTKGDFLLVGIESDIRVKQLKGPSRPIQTQNDRLSQLERLPYVDLAFILPESFSSPKAHEQLVATLRPDILAVSSHTPNLKAKREILSRYGGRVEVVYPHNASVSTTLALINSS